MLLAFLLAVCLLPAWADEPAFPGGTGLIINEKTRAEDAKYLRVFPITKSYPTQLDWRDHGMVTPARDQGWCGSCWAFGVTAAIESQLLIRFGLEFDLSEQYLVSCETTSMGCDGGYLNSALGFFYNREFVEESCYPYTAQDDPCDESCVGIGAYGVDESRFRVYFSDREQVIAVLNDYGPLAFGWLIASDFGPYWRSSGGGSTWPDGIYLNKSGNQGAFGHAVQLIGYNSEDEYWILKNSWGRTGGPFGDGSFKMAWSGHNLD
jgi:hypothetical protein